MNPTLGKLNMSRNMTTKFAEQKPQELVCEMAALS